MLPFHLLLGALYFPILASALAPAIPTITPSPALVERCEHPPCEFGGTQTTLTAATVTTTVLSTTSVPCYITTYVTNEKTTTSTVYSTETLTSTVTHEGTVTVIRYSPTPVLMSSTYESTIAFTQTFTTYWQTITGSDSETTITGTETKTIGGGQGTPSGNTGGTITYPSSQPTSGTNTWTHANPNTTITYSFASPTPPTGTGTAWTHLGAGASSMTNLQAFQTGDNNPGSVNWAGGAGQASDAQVKMVMIGAVVTILIWEAIHFLT